MIGDFALLPGLKLPTGSQTRGTGTGTTDVSMVLISSHVFGPLSLDVNIGGTARSGGGVAAPKRASLWTAALGLFCSGLHSVGPRSCMVYPGTCRTQRRGTGARSALRSDLDAPPLAGIGCWRDRPGFRPQPQAF